MEKPNRDVHKKMGHSCREAKILEKMILYQQLGRWHCPDILDDKKIWCDLTHNYGKSPFLMRKSGKSTISMVENPPFLMGKSTISMVIFQ